LELGACSGPCFCDCRALSFQPRWSEGSENERSNRWGLEALWPAADLLVEESELLVATEELRAQHLPLPEHPDPRPGGRRGGIGGE